jgi:predicted dithiol-disulfide oxidoreductase (DUF899 family)
MKNKKKTKAPVKPKIVLREAWLKARKKLLAREKAFTRLRDKLSAERRKLPWVLVEKDYVFEGPEGKVRLADLFGDKSQLIVYHFMFDPKWEEGCPSCSYLSDHYDGALIHLAHRDTAFAAISRAPFEKIRAFKKRMDWRFPWVSSNTSEFNYDYGVSFTKEGIAKGQAFYNYEKLKDPDDAGEGPGLSVFYKDKTGRIFHTYSTFARGLDILVGTYNFLDLVPKGRDEDKLAFTMAWVRHHDKYDDGYSIDPKASYTPPKDSAA